MKRHLLTSVLALAAVLLTGTTATAQLYSSGNNIVVGTNVGIGNATPAYPLDVTGGINLSIGSAVTIGGVNALNSNGTRNIHIGQNAGIISTGDQNAMIGYNAGLNNTTGAKNTFIGATAGRLNTTGSQNAFIGGRAGFDNTIGSQNSFIGWLAGRSNSTGSQNSFIGKYAGFNNTTGTLNTYIGSNAGGSATLTNATAIGAGASVTQNNSVVLGNNANVGIGTSAPGYKLDVTGDINFTGDLYDNGVLFTGPTGSTGATGATGAIGATGATGPLISGSANSTLYNSGGTWVSSTNLQNNGNSVAVGGSSSANSKLFVSNTDKQIGLEVLHNSSSTVSPSMGVSVDARQNGAVNTFGLYNRVESDGTNSGSLFGIYNFMVGDNISGMGSVIGTQTTFNSSLVGTGKNLYGSYINFSGTPTGNEYAYYAYNGTSYFGGNVGVGTTTPAYDLDVAGDINFTGTIYQNGNAFIGSGTSGQTLRHDGTSWVSSGVLMNNGTDVGVTGQLNVGSGAEGHLYNSGTNFEISAEESLLLRTGVGGYDLGILSGASGTPFAIFEGANENLLLGTTTPDSNSKLRVVHDGLYAGHFSTNSTSASAQVMHVEYTGVGNYQTKAIYAGCTPADGYGTGIFATGGKWGVYGFGDGGAWTGSTSGLYGLATGTAGERYGVFGSANNPGGNVAYGIYGTATGATTNWAGYFNDGNVYMANNVGIGTDTPESILHVNASYPIAKLQDASGSNFGGQVQFGGTVAGSFERRAFIEMSTVDQNLLLTGYNGVEVWDHNGSAPGRTLIAEFTVNGTEFNRKIFPRTDNFYDIGAASFRWNDVYATNGVIQTSDRRDKKNILDMAYGLKELNALRPVTFEWKSESQIGTKLGLIAQEVLEVIPEVVKTQDWVYSEKDGERELVDNERLGIYYSHLVPLVIKAVQEQQVQIEKLKPEAMVSRQEFDALQSENEGLKTQVSGLTDRLGRMEELLSRFDSDLQNCCINYQEGSSTGINDDDLDVADAPVLEQNSPNPFRENSTIKYYLPRTIQSAELLISDLNGVVLKIFNLQGKGFGQVLISGGSFVAGTYIYTLNVNGKKVAAKKMMLL